MKIDTIILEDPNGEGEPQVIDKSSFVKIVEAQFPDMKGLAPRNQDTGEVMEEARMTVKDTIVNLIGLFEGGTGESVDWSSDQFAEYSEPYQWIEEQLSASQALVEERKKAEEAEKEAKKAEKEKEAALKKEQEAAVVANQNAFLAGAVTGAQAAGEAYKDQLQAIGSSMPKGVKINGYAMDFDDELLKANPGELIGQTIGALAQHDENLSQAKNALAFWMGDMVNKLVSVGVYPSARKAGDALSEHFKAKNISSFGSGRMFRRYAPMSRLVAPEDRNPAVDATAYLTIVEAGPPKRGDKEELSSYNARKEAHLADKKKIIHDLNQGEMTLPAPEEGGNPVVVELKSTKDVKKVVEDLQIHHKVKEKADPDKFGTSDWLRLFFWASWVDEYWDNIGAKGNNPENRVFDHKDAGLHELSRADVNTLKEAAKTNLENIFLTGESGKDKWGTAEILSGLKTVHRKVTETGEDGQTRIKKGEDGKDILNAVQIPCYAPLLAKTVGNLTKFTPADAAPTTAPAADTPAAPATA